jgi:hypothetical protein
MENNEPIKYSQPTPEACSEILLPGEKIQGFIDMLSEFEHSLAPRGAVERMLVETIVINNWRSWRMRVLETALVRDEIDRRTQSYPVTDREDAKQDVCEAVGAYRSLTDQSRILELFRRGESRYTRGSDAALRLLLDLRQRKAAPPASHSPELPVDGN